MSKASLPPQPMRERAIRLLAMIALEYSAFYLVWRATSTLNPDAWLLSLLLLVAEVQGVLNSALFAFMAWDVRKTPPFAYRADCTVDVLVPTCNEDVQVLEATLAGCNCIRYPHTTYVLDDGRRPEVARLAQRMGCQYLTRDGNLHAKAGNLNAALARTSGDFIVIVDADTVPQPEFVDRTIGYFVDDRVALVQLPQEFYNLDSVQHRGEGRPREAWHEQALFFRVIQAGKNRWNAAFWCGSPSILRRAALEDVGGIATESVTEDLHTSLRLHSRGWKTVYHPEPLAYGIAPQTLQAFAVQRLRWAQGTMQILRTRENPIIMPGLSVAQRLNYVASTFTYFDAFQKLIFLLVPTLVLLTGVLPLRVSAADYLLRAVPYFALMALTNVALGRGNFRLIAVEQYNVLKMFLFIWASTQLAWRRSLRFRVTPKSTSGSVHAGERKALWAHFLLLAVVAISLVFALLNMVWGFGAKYDRPDLIVVTMLWAVVNAALLVSGAAMVLRRAYSRQQYRFPIRLTMTAGQPNGRFLAGYTEDLSREGCALVTDQPVSVGTQLSLRITAAGQWLRLTGSVLRCRGVHANEYRLGIAFDDHSPEQARQLVQFLFVVAAHDQQRGGLAQRDALAADPRALEGAA